MPKFGFLSQNHGSYGCNRWLTHRHPPLQALVWQALSSGSFRVAHASHVLAMASSLSRTFPCAFCSMDNGECCKECFGATPKPKHAKRGRYPTPRQPRRLQPATNYFSPIMSHLEITAADAVWGSSVIVGRPPRWTAPLGKSIGASQKRPTSIIATASRPRMRRWTLSPGWDGPRRGSLSRC